MTQFLVEDLDLDIEFTLDIIYDSNLYDKLQNADSELYI